MIVAIVNTLDPLLGIFANASILAQSMQLLLEGISVYWSANACLLVITIVAILPLCLMKNLNALAPFSALGMAAVLLALAAMTWRYLDGSYREGGIYYDDVPQDFQPKFGNYNNPWSTAVLPFVCMVYTSFDMHYNSPRFYVELRDATIPRFGQTVAYSFGVTAVVYFLIAVVGFVTFGANCDSYILNNYSPKDVLASVSRLAIGLCSLVSYPLNFIGVRDNCLDILGIADKVDTDSKLNVFTLLLLVVLTVSSCFVTDLGLINSVGGGTTVVLVCFVFPMLMFRDGLKKYGRGTVGEQRELWLVMILMVVGVVLGIVGVWDSIIEA
jgi:sodium-coupled neutral amino acid transporter 11